MMPDLPGECCTQVEMQRGIDGRDGVNGEKGEQGEMGLPGPHGEQVEVCACSGTWSQQASVVLPIPFQWCLV